MAKGYGKETPYYQAIVAALGKETVEMQFREPEAHTQFNNLLMLRVIEKLENVELLLTNLVKLSTPNVKAGSQALPVHPLGAAVNTKVS